MRVAYDHKTKELKHRGGTMMGQKDVERQKPTFEGKSAEEFIKRWNAVTKAIKMRAETSEQGKAVSYDVIR